LNNKNNNDGFRNSDRLTHWVKILLIAQIVVSVIALVSNYLEYQLLTDFADGFYASDELASMDAEVSDDRQMKVGLLQVGIFLVSALLILRWIHRANYNSHQLGAEDMKFTPGWSIGYYFIPILTLWKPYQAMKEIWQTSQNPRQWQTQMAPSILSLWWAIWLVNGSLGRVIFKMSSTAEELPELINLNLMNQVSDFLDIPSAVVLLLMVKNIYQMQQKRLSEQVNAVPTHDSQNVVLPGSESY